MADRYARQSVLPEIGAAGQQRLADARVLVIGAGGLGCPALQYLAAAGVGTIGILDDDRVDLSNLQRQVLYSSASVGLQKAVVAREVLGALNPEIDIAAHTERLTVSTAERYLPAYDLVLDGSDNFGTRYLVNDACVTYKKPFIAASIHQHGGQISAFNILEPDGSRGPTLRCLFPDPPDAGAMPACAQAGVLGSVAGVLGSLMAEETLKWIVGFGESLSGRLVQIDCATLHVTSVRFVRQPGADSQTIQPQQIYDAMNACAADGSISARELITMVSRAPVALVDVREHAERENGHIGGQHIPLAELAGSSILEARLPVVLYCASGARSEHARRQLIACEQAAGKEILSLAGGLGGMSLEDRKMIISLQQKRSLVCSAPVFSQTGEGGRDSSAK